MRPFLGGLVRQQIEIVAPLIVGLQQTLPPTFFCPVREIGSRRNRPGWRDVMMRATERDQRRRRTRNLQALLAAAVLALSAPNAPAAEPPARVIDQGNQRIDAETVRSYF